MPILPEDFDTSPRRAAAERSASARRRLLAERDRPKQHGEASGSAQQGGGGPRGGGSSRRAIFFLLAGLALALVLFASQKPLSRFVGHLRDRPAPIVVTPPPDPTHEVSGKNIVVPQDHPPADESKVISPSGTTSSNTTTADPGPSGTEGSNPNPLRDGKPPSASDWKAQMSIRERERADEATRLQHQLAESQSARDQVEKERLAQQAEITATREKLLQETQARERVESEQRLAQQKIEEQIRQQQIAEEQRRIAEQEQRKIRDPLSNYRGARSGVLTWEGEVHGKTLVTFMDGSPSSGRILSGEVPIGIPLIFQPQNEKRVGIASSPGARDDFRSFVFRVSGNGTTRVVLQWSLP